MQCIELCAGMGGMALGLNNAGFSHALCLENNEKCIQTLKENGIHNAVLKDVCTFEYDTIKNVYNEIHLVAGGVPCQGFSNAGLHLGKNDPRNLWSDAIRFVRDINPRAFFFENSQSMLGSKHVNYLNEIVTEFEGMSYRVWKHKVDMSLHDCPQKRVRLFLIGIRSEFAHKYHEPVANPKYTKTVRMVIDDLVPFENDHVFHTARACVYKGHTPSVLDKPSKTIVAGTHGCGGGTNTIQMDDGSIRYYTPREMARIQTFPDTYILPTIWTDVVKQLGNAVPPHVVSIFSKAIRRSIE
jgi:DNA (cytosine-5)-methyltransferase 1